MALPRSLSFLASGALLLGVGLLPVAAVHAAMDHSSHDAHAHDQADDGAEPHPHGYTLASERLVLKLDNGQRWPIDAALHEGMLGIRAALASRLEGIHQDSLGDLEYKALGEEVTAQIATIINNCKLPADADAQLHLLIAELMRGVAMTEVSYTGADPRPGALVLLNALAKYPRYFADDDFPPLAH